MLSAIWVFYWLASCGSLMAFRRRVGRLFRYWTLGLATMLLFNITISAVTLEYVIRRSGRPWFTSTRTHGPFRTSSVVLEIYRSWYHIQCPGQTGLPLLGSFASCGPCLPRTGVALVRGWEMRPMFLSQTSRCLHILLTCLPSMHSIVWPAPASLLSDYLDIFAGGLSASFRFVDPLRAGGGGGGG
jgi:hypothetical protein